MLELGDMDKNINTHYILSGHMTTNQQSASTFPSAVEHKRCLFEVQSLKWKLCLEDFSQLLFVVKHEAATLHQTPFTKTGSLPARAEAAHH